MRQDCRVEEVSLIDALLHAHEFTGLAGELPTQDAAILRLLLAVLHAVFERVDITGERSEIETADDAFDRWVELWDMGQFPQKPLLNYLRLSRINSGYFILHYRFGRSRKQAEGQSMMHKN
jgi:CRISPR system Cascade subunit CasA